MMHQLLKAIDKFLSKISRHALSIFIQFATLPYYRLYYFNTLKPLQQIALKFSRSHPDDLNLLQVISSWRARKLAELQFITIACTVLAAAVIGAFSWATIETAHWLAQGFWHCSLLFSVLGILLSSSEVTVLQLLGPLVYGKKPRDSVDAIKRYQPLLVSATEDPEISFIPRVKMLFTWQSPLMFMSYSVCCFLAGLTVLVTTPLIRERSHWTGGHTVAVIYLTVFAGAGAIYVFCSFWVYHYVKLEFGDLAVIEQLERHEEAWNLRDILVPSMEVDMNTTTIPTTPTERGEERVDQIKTVRSD